MMKKQMKKIDLIAGLGLVSMVTLTAVGQVVPGPKPTPITHTCPGFTVYRFNGDPVVIENWECPEGQDCIQITIYDSKDRVVGAAGGCIDPQ